MKSSKLLYDQFKSGQSAIRSSKESALDNRAITTQSGTLRSVKLATTPRIMREQAFTIKQKCNSAVDENKKLKKEIDKLRVEYNTYEKFYKSLVIKRKI